MKENQNFWIIFKKLNTPEFLCSKNLSNIDSNRMIPKEKSFKTQFLFQTNQILFFSNSTVLMSKVEAQKYFQLKKAE